MVNLLDGVSKIIRFIGKWRVRRSLDIVGLIDNSMILMFFLCQSMHLLGKLSIRILFCLRRWDFVDFHL